MARATRVHVAAEHEGVRERNERVVGADGLEPGFDDRQVRMRFLIRKPG